MIEILKLDESKENIPFYSINNNYNSINKINGKTIYKSISAPKSNGAIQRININNKINTKNFIKFNNNYINKRILNIKNSKKISLNFIPENIFIKHLFFYLDINNLPLISLINHKFLSMIKIHFFIRIYLLKKEKRDIEEKNKEIFNLIKAKRKTFFKQYEINEPSKEHALKLINQMTEKDFIELKQYFKVYNKNYEKIIISFLLLLGEKPISNINSDKNKQSFYNSSKKIIFSPHYIKRIKSLELELLPNKIFKLIEKIMKEDEYSEKINRNLYPCFNKLINWILGILEFHRAIRKYSLSHYDYEILNKEEINFCIRMDNIILLYFKLKRYISKYCKEYENKSEKIMKEMGLIN